MSYIPLNKDSLVITKCITCNRKYTKSMMLEVNVWAKRYRCIRCYNRKENNANNTRNVIS